MLAYHLLINYHIVIYVLHRLFVHNIKSLNAEFLKAPCWAHCCFCYMLMIFMIPFAGDTHVFDQGKISARCSMLWMANYRNSRNGCRCDGSVVACGAMSLWQSVVPWSRHSDSSSIFNIYIQANLYIYIYAEFLTRIPVLIPYLIGSEAKWPTFRSKRHFLMYFLKWKLKNFDKWSKFQHGIRYWLCAVQATGIV